MIFVPSDSFSVRKKLNYKKQLILLLLMLMFRMLLLLSIFCGRPCPWSPTDLAEIVSDWYDNHLCNGDTDGQLPIYSLLSTLHWQNDCSLVSLLRRKVQHLHSYFSLLKHPPWAYNDLQTCLTKGVLSVFTKSFWMLWICSITSALAQFLPTTTSCTIPKLNYRLHEGISKVHFKLATNYLPLTSSVLLLEKTMHSSSLHFPLMISNTSFGCFASPLFYMLQNPSLLPYKICSVCLTTLLPSLQTTLFCGKPWHDGSL